MMQKHSSKKLKTSPKNVVVLKNPAPFNLSSKGQAA
jgi:hypothetical protein